MSEAGKGSGRRPLQVPKDQFDNNWDAIFGKKKEIAMPCKSKRPKPPKR